MNCPKLTGRLSEYAKSDEEKVRDFEKQYDEILDKAEEEYADNPPSDYYKEGYNLFLRLRKYKENELLFLHDKRVPANNSLCERLARVYKQNRNRQSLCEARIIWDIFVMV